MMKYCHPERSRGIFFACLLLFAPLSAHAADSVAPDVVEVMRGLYVEQFREFPPSRKCTPEDARNAWKEMAIYESAGNAEVTAQKAQGPNYLAFGEYNTMVWQRLLVPPERAAFMGTAPKSGLQYISTTAGMLYVYRHGALQHSLLCFITTAPTQKYPVGMLVLARAIEKDKPLLATVYAPFEK